MTLTFKLACMLLALLCFAVGFIVGTWGPAWPRTGGVVALGLFFVTLGATFG